MLWFFTVKSVEKDIMMNMAHKNKIDQIVEVVKKQYPCGTCRQECIETAIRLTVEKVRGRIIQLGSKNKSLINLYTELNEDEWLGEGEEKHE